MVNNLNDCEGLGASKWIKPICLKAATSKMALFAKWQVNKCTFIATKSHLLLMNPNFQMAVRPLRFYVLKYKLRRFYCL